MNRLFHIAYREFAATVFTKTFFFGVVVVPLIITALIPVAVLLVSQKPPAVRGSVAIIDRSGPPGAEQGLVMPRLMQLLSQEAIEARIKDDVAQVAKVTGEFFDKIGPKMPESLVLSRKMLLARAARLKAMGAK